MSQRLRKRIEECFGWGKMVGGLAQVKVRGLDKVRAVFVFGVAAYNLFACPGSWLRRAKCVQPRKRKRK